MKKLSKQEAKQLWLTHFVAYGETQQKNTLNIPHKLI